MTESHQGAIKGLAVATIVLSTLAIVSCAIILCVLGFIANNISTYALTYDYGDYSYYGYGHGGHHGYEYSPYFDDYMDDLYDYYLSPNEAALLEFAMFIARLLLGFAMIANLISLAAGIITLINVKKIEKYGLIFGWNIAGAIVGFLGAGLITAVLCIICAVFANKDKRAAQVAAAIQGNADACVPGFQTQSTPPQMPVTPAPVVQQPVPTAYPQPAPEPQAASDPAPTSAITTAVITDPLIIKPNDEE